MARRRRSRRKKTAKPEDAGAAKPADSDEPVKPADSDEPVKPADNRSAPSSRPRGDEPVKPADNDEPVKPADEAPASGEPAKTAPETKPVPPADAAAAPAADGSAGSSSSAEKSPRKKRSRRSSRAKTPAKKGSDTLMLINVLEPEECRVGLLENGVLEGLFIERTSAGDNVGNIYKGVVLNIERSIQAAFIDFGSPRHGFLHVSDVVPPAPPARRDRPAADGRDGPRSRRHLTIQNVLHRGQEIVVQVTRAGIGRKGPALTTYLSIPGRYLVLMPGIGRTGVSRKIEDEAQRARLKDLLKDLSPPEGLGFIIRTAGAEQTKRELARDLNYLLRLWTLIGERVKTVKAPAEIYRESDLVIRTMRDIFTADIQQVLVDNPEVAQRAREFVRAVMPRYADRIQTYEGAEPLFHKYGVEEEVERLNQRRVGLPGGGSIVIEQTEALVAIDVNTGTFRAGGRGEETLFRTDLAAAKEIPRQLRLRDLGGVIVIDFIDLRDAARRREVEQTLREGIRRDRARTRVLRMSQFGIVEMTRQRQKGGVERALYEDCPTCRGTGRVKSAESMALDVMRRLSLLLARADVAGVDIHLNEAVAHYLINRKRRAILALEEATKKRVVIRVDHELGVEDTTTTCYGSSGETVKINA